MRELHVVAVSEDGRHLLLAGTRGATSGGFRVAIDDRLVAAVRGDLPRPGEVAPGPELTPKDIQARLRAGESAEAIAVSAGVPVTRVERFAGPVQGEMARVIDAARSAHLVRGRLGRSALPLGEAVDQALAQTPSLRPESLAWSTHREDAGSWLVTVTWYARARSRTASWQYDPATGALTAADPASAALGHVDAEAGAHRRTASTRPAATRPATSAVRRAGQGKKAAAKPAAKSVAKPTAKAAKATAKSTAKSTAKAAGKAGTSAGKPVKAAAKVAASGTSATTPAKARRAAAPSATRAAARTASRAT
ncbi:MAG: septation protein SepH, partial [Mycobacteriales bacterium]